MSRQLEEILNEKLYHAELELPDGDWDVLAQKMAAEKRKKRFAIAWWWAATAACIALVFLAVNFAETSHETGNLTASNETETVEQKITSENENLLAETKIEPQKTVATPTRKSKKAESQSAEKAIVEPNIAQENPVSVAENSEILEQTENVQESVARPTEEAETTKPQLAESKITPEEAERILNASENSTKTAAANTNFSRWSVGLVSSTSLLTKEPQNVASSSIMRAPRPNQHTAKHDFPVTFGAQVGVTIVPRLDIQTGVSYTFLRSSFDYYNLNETKNQQCHYLGLPLAVSYRFVDRKIIKCYVSAGGMFEKGLSQDVETFKDGQIIDKERNTIEGVQWSIMGNVGVAITLYKGLNLYVEPGCSWYIPSSKIAQPETKRTETPFNFNLAMGLRFNFEKK